MTSWPLEEYHKVMDRGKSWVALDILLFCMALQDAINRAQRGDRLNPLLFEALLDRCSTPLCAALRQRPTPGDDVLCNQLRRLARLAPGLRAPTGCPAWIVSLGARFPFIEPAFGAVQLAADRLDGVSGQIARDCLVSTVFLRGAHPCLLTPVA